MFNTSLFKASKHVWVNKSRPMILPSYQLQNLRDGPNKGPGLHKENLLRSVDIETATKANKASVNNISVLYKSYTNLKRLPTLFGRKRG